MWEINSHILDVSNTGSYGYEKALRDIESRERASKLLDYDNYGTEVEDEDQ